MPDHDMSQATCQARAERNQEHEKLKEDVIELFARSEAILNVLAVFANNIESDDPILNELKEVMGGLTRDH
jgi:hypothetical protein